MAIHGPAACLTCGNAIAHNPKAFGMISTRYDGAGRFVGEGKGAAQPLEGWHHAAYSETHPDHLPIPADDRSTGDEAIRVAAGKNRARVQVDKTLGSQFALLDAEHIINNAAGK